MKQDDIPSLQSLTTWVKPIAPLSQPLRPGEVKLQSTDVSGEYQLLQAQSSCLVTVANRRDASWIDQTLAAFDARLAILDEPASVRGANLTLHRFPGEVLHLDEIVIALSAEACAAAVKKEPVYKDIAILGAYLSASCQFGRMDGASDDFLFVAGDPSDPQGKFSLVGSGARVQVSPAEAGVGQMTLAATALTLGAGKPQGMGAIRLARGRVRFVDFSQVQHLQALATEAMRRLMRAEDGYLRQWDAYGEVEGDSLLTRARDMGALHIKKVEPSEDCIGVFTDPAPSDALRIGDSVEIVDDIPAHLAPESLMTWAEYRESKADKEQNLSAAIIRVSGKSVTLKGEALDGHVVGKFLILSLVGDKKQIERRDDARRRVVEGQSANPLLGMIIEGDPDLPPMRRPPELKPLTAGVQAKVFKNEPTLTQVRAIKLALNTPDIAIIQGPPGTGKTTVITAIIERLNEERDRTRSVEGNVLVTGYQHDAVENIIARLRVNALPPVKFGARPGEKGVEYQAKVRQWCDDLAKSIRERNPEVCPSAARQRIGKDIRDYLNMPTDTKGAAVLDEILALPSDVLGEDLAERCRDLAETLADEAREREEAASGEHLTAIRRLRVTKVGFADDGPYMAREVGRLCATALAPKDQALLRRAGDWQAGAELDFLSALAALKQSLLLLYSPRPVFRVDKARDDLLILLDEVTESLKQAEYVNGDPTSSVLAEFLDELETCSDGVIAAIQDYNFVFAATCQQAEGSEIRKAKLRGVKKANRDSLPVYDTVIVDEAARVGPRDLLIPLGQGERRLILVGDHRQLPHLIDQEIARAVEQAEGYRPPASVKDWAAGRKVGGREISMFEISMFEHLIERLKRMTDKDRIDRVITLDAQYRMHPLLGKFVSDQFYAPYGEGYDSPLSAENFAHSLSGVENTAVVWLNIPASMGREVKGASKSRSRICEAKAIAKHLAEWIDSEEGRGLNFGIISFYKDQVNAVYEALHPYGMTERLPDGAWTISKRYRFLGDGHGTEERLRIGTVDSFQGKEFDVVFLSMVRNASQHCNTLSANRVFGRLMMANLLCVSMSRQKRLLVIAGDSAVLDHPEAKEAVPALCAYLRLCRTDGVMLEGATS